MVRYKDDDDFRHFCGMLDGLAFLPVDSVPAGMAYLRTVVPAWAEPLVEFFDATYVTGIFRNTVRPNGNMVIRRVPPLFEPKLWNVNSVTINDGHRTNNISEAGNRRFLAVIGNAHPNIWKCIDFFQNEEKRFRVTVTQNEAGMAPMKRVRRETQQHQDRLNNLCLKLNSGEKTKEEFIQGIGHNIRLGGN